MADTPGLAPTAKVQSIASLKTAADLNKKVERLKQGRGALENRWKLNLMFYQGKQYAYYSKRLNRVLSLPTATGEIPRHRIRITSNQIIKGAHKLLAKLTKTKPQFAATPGSADPSAIKAAKVAESLADNWWQQLNLSRKYAEALLWAIITGSGFWLVTYDKLEGDPMTFLMEPDPNDPTKASDKPIVNDELKKMFLAQLEQVGIPADNYYKTIYPGEIDVDVLDPRKVYLDDSVSDFEDAKWAICKIPMAPSDVKDRWGKEVEPDSIPEQEDANTIFNLSNQVEKNAVTVWCLYAIPTPSLPKGRYVCWTGDEILEDGPYPYSHGELPLIRFSTLKNPTNPYGSSVVEHALDDQKEYNRLLSKVVEFLVLTLTPRVWGPVGSFRGRLTNEPGQYLEYTPIGGLKPEVENLPNLPPYVFEHINMVKARLDEDFFVNEIGDGTPPPNVEAGIAIDLLQEAASDSFAPIALENEKALGDALGQMLKLAQDYYNEPRMLQITGLAGSPQIKEFLMKDMDPDVRIRVEASSSMPRTRAGKIALALELSKQGVIQPQNLWKYIDTPDLRTLAVKAQLDEDQALREHEMLIQGQPINLQAIEEAQEQVQNQQDFPPLNPTTGQPFTSQQELQDFLSHAGIQPHLFENMETHLDVHGSYMKSVEFEQLPQDAQGRIYDHFQATFERYMQLHPLPENVRVTHQIKSTVGPTAASQILTQAGVTGINPEIMMEPPLDSIVIDNANQPENPDAIIAPIKHAADIAQQQAQMAQQGMQQANADEAHRLQMQHAHEKHTQSLQHADQQHAAKLQQMKSQSTSKTIRESNQ